MNTLNRVLEPQGAGYPEAFVAARLKPRLLDLYTLADAGRSLQRKERDAATAWSYRQLPDKLRRTFEPLYLYLQLPGLLDALRFATAGLDSQAGRTLEGSLWHRDVVRSLRPRGGRNSPFEELAAHLRACGWKLPKTLAIEDMQPLQWFEGKLYAAVLEPRHRRSTACERLLATLRDLYNLAQYRDTARPPIPEALLNGGHLQTKDYPDPARLQRAVHRTYGRRDAAGDHETHVARAVTAEYRHRTRDCEIQYALSAFLWQLTGRAPRHDAGTHQTRAA